MCRSKGDTNAVAFLVYALLMSLPLAYTSLATAVEQLVHGLDDDSWSLREKALYICSAFVAYAFIPTIFAAMSAGTVPNATCTLINKTAAGACAEAGGAC